MSEFRGFLFWSVVCVVRWFSFSVFTFFVWGFVLRNLGFSVSSS